MLGRVREAVTSVRMRSFFALGGRARLALLGWRGFDYAVWSSGAQRAHFCVCGGEG